MRPGLGFFIGRLLGFRAYTIGGRKNKHYNLKIPKIISETNKREGIEP